MLVARADIALQSGDLDAAADWARKAIDNARGVRRRKYESIGRRILGETLLQMSRGPEALAELRAAVELADALVSPPGRWQSRAALGRALYATGDDEGAGAAYREAAEVIRSMAATLSPEHEKSLLGAPPVQEVLRPEG
jgi:tetratricopeptide (TPR) repeat protein